MSSRAFIVTGFSMAAIGLFTILLMLLSTCGGRQRGRNSYNLIAISGVK